MDLAQLRSEIDRIDSALITILEERASVVHAIQQSKSKQGGPARDPKREREIIERLSKNSSLPPELISELYAVLFKYSTTL